MLRVRDVNLMTGVEIWVRAALMRISSFCPPGRLHKQHQLSRSAIGTSLKPRLPLVSRATRDVFSKHCLDLIHHVRVSAGALVGDDPREHMAGDIPGRNGKGQYGKPR